jgi:hypothetical protein
MTENSDSNDPISDNNVTTTNGVTDAYETPMYSNISRQTWDLQEEDEEVECGVPSPEMILGIPVGGGGEEQSGTFPHPNVGSNRNRFRPKLGSKGIGPPPLQNNYGTEELFVCHYIIM